MRTSVLNQDQLDRVKAVLPRWLVEKVPRDHREPDAAFHRRRRVVAGVSVLGAGLLGVSLSTKPDSTAFYVTSFGVAGTWLAGGFASGRLHLGWMQARDETLKRPVVTPVLTGVAAFGVFYGCALVCRHVPVLDQAISSVLRFADKGSSPLVYLTTLVNGASEEVFFRGALFAAIGRRRPIVISTVIYALVTVATGNPMLVFAAVVMGLLFGLQRRASGGILASMLTHLVWSVVMLLALPPIIGK